MAGKGQLCGVGGGCVAEETTFSGPVMSNQAAAACNQTYHSTTPTAAPTAQMTHVYLAIFTQLLKHYPMRKQQAATFSKLTYDYKQRWVRTMCAMCCEHGHWARYCMCAVPTGLMLSTKYAESLRPFE